jgi:hypothetical protein
MSKLKSQQKATVMPGSAGKLTVLNPACSSTMAERVPLARRTFTSLEGKTIYLVDIGWGGPKAGYDVFEVMQGWFAENIPSVKTVLFKKKGSYAEDDPELWKKIKAEGDACIIGLSC